MLENRIDLIIPTYNEDHIIKEHLEYHDHNFNFDSITVIDGNSDDSTRSKIESARADVNLIERSPAGRAEQLSEGVRCTNSEWILFLHADSWIPESFDKKDIFKSKSNWGWFDLTLDRSDMIYTIISSAITIRSAFLRNPTGDQGIWVHRSILEEVGGVPRQPLMEDVELVNRLRSAGRGHRINKPITTSARRWSESGVVKTILTMWSLKLAYKIGVSPKKLDTIYRSDKKTIL